MSSELIVKGVSRIYKVGPRKVGRAGKDLACIYLPKKLSFLRGKTVMVTIEVLEDGV